MGFPGGSAVKNTPAMQETWVLSLDWKDSPGGGNGNPLQYFCLENSMDKRSLVGYGPWGCKESDTANTFISQLFETNQSSHNSGGLKSPYS